ncbi:hypothetical protein NEPTK9_001687 [Candidatus Neptunochlamydia vexilliferae]|uniref:Secreted protein n=1 Tax=Candidatus Neptunichlamydia vexilliferae TaxID=1651774 RepID=A0ABS0B2Q4_9BACT|nr:hypothetical protein [Candidatus Neptunochlamydia vexilliferae]
MLLKLVLLAAYLVSFVACSQLEHSHTSFEEQLEFSQEEGKWVKTQKAREKFSF